MLYASSQDINKIYFLKLLKDSLSTNTHGYCSDRTMSWWRVCSS